jgi:hypothetical protein
MRLIANENVFVYGRALKAGDEFEVPDTEGRVWMLTGKAQQKRGPGRPRKEDAAYYHRADMRAEDE